LLIAKSHEIDPHVAFVSCSSLFTLANVRTAVFFVSFTLLKRNKNSIQNSQLNDVNIIKGRLAEQ